MNLSKASGTSFGRCQYAGKVLPMYPDYSVTFVPGLYHTSPPANKRLQRTGISIPLIR